MSKNTEIELKLLMDKANVRKLLKLECVAPFISAEGAKKRKLVSTYYDTVDFALKNAGIAYRVRAKGDGTYEATVKTTQKSSAGLSERLELNLPLEKAEPVLTGFAELGLEYELTDLAPEGVEELFSVQVERTTYMLEWEGATVELAIDNGKVVAGRKSEKIAEVELELVDGDIAVLMRKVAEIASVIPVFVEKRSKFARGLALRGLVSDEDTVSKRSAFHEGEAVKDALVRVVSERGDALLTLEKELLVAEAIDMDLLKQVRKQLVALRAYLAFAAEVSEGAFEGFFTLEQNIEDIENLLLLFKLQDKWGDIYERYNSMLSRSVLEKTLDEEIVETIEILQEAARRGEYTALVFAAQSWLLNTAWPNEEFLDLQSTLLSCLRKWHEVLFEDIGDDPEAVEDFTEGDLLDFKTYAENTLALLRSLEGRVGVKHVKAFVSSMKNAYELQVSLGILADFASASTSKNLQRDVAFLQGYLVAEN